MRRHRTPKRLRWHWRSSLFAMEALRHWRATNAEVRGDRVHWGWVNLHRQRIPVSIPLAEYAANPFYENLANT